MYILWGKEKKWTSKYGKAPVGVVVVIIEINYQGINNKII